MGSLLGRRTRQRSGMQAAFTPQRQGAGARSMAGPLGLTDRQNAHRQVRIVQRNPLRVRLRCLASAREPFARCPGGGGSAALHSELQAINITRVTTRITNLLHKLPPTRGIPPLPQWVQDSAGKPCNAWTLRFPLFRLNALADGNQSRTSDENTNFRTCCASRTRTGHGPRVRHVGHCQRRIITVVRPL